MALSGILSQKTEIRLTTAVKTSNCTNENMFMKKLRLDKFGGRFVPVLFPSPLHKNAKLKINAIVISLVSYGYLI
jgi:hypothetical protein